MTNTFIIGICGPSGSGKSSIAKALEKQYPEQVKRLRFDNFYKAKRDSPRSQGPIDFEHPNNFDFENLTEILHQLKHIGYATIPVYNKTRDRIVARELTTVTPITILEGFLIYHNTSVRDQIDSRTFLEVDPETLFERRNARQKSMNREYYDRLVVPSFERYGKPQQKYCTIIIDGNRPLEEVVADYAALVDEVLSIRQTKNIEIPASVAATEATTDI